MKLLLASCAIALTAFAVTPASAQVSVVKWGNGQCSVWHGDAKLAYGGKAVVAKAKNDADGWGKVAALKKKKKNGCA